MSVKGKRKAAPVREEAGRIWDGGIVMLPQRLICLSLLLFRKLKQGIAVDAKETPLGQHFRS